MDLFHDTGQLSAENHLLRSDCGDPLPDPCIYVRLVGKLLYLTINDPKYFS